MTKTIKIAALLSLMTTSGVAVGGAVLTQNNVLIAKGADEPYEMVIDSSSTLTDFEIGPDYNNGVMTLMTEVAETHFGDNGAYLSTYIMFMADPQGKEKGKDADYTRDDDMDVFDIKVGGDNFLEIGLASNYNGSVWFDVCFQFSQVTNLSWSTSGGASWAFGACMYNYNSASDTIIEYTDEMSKTVSNLATSAGGKYLLDFCTELDSETSSFKINKITSTYYCN